jgi:hypothetical protein
MILLLREISVPEFRQHLLRYALTLLGLLLEVAIFSTVHTANSSLKTALCPAVDQIAGQAVLQMKAGQTGILEYAVDDVRSVPGARAVCMGFVAVILGAVVGSTRGFYILATCGVSITGWFFPYEFPRG